MTSSGAVRRLANGAGLFAWDTGGDGPAIVFCHPMSGNHASWALQRDAFVAAGYRLVGYSRRGHYGSERGPADDIGTQAGDLAQLLDVLGIERAHVTGSAAGGSTALDFALAYPGRTRSAVVASSLMSIAEPDYQERSERARPDWFHGLPLEARELSASFRAMDPDGVAAFLAIDALNGFGPVSPPVRQPLASRIDWPALDANTVPVLLMTGGADLYLPPALLRWTAPRIACAETLVIPDAGHPLFLEAHEAFNAAVLAFVARHGGRLD